MTKSSKNNPIGVFDSGIGGLTVAKEIIKMLPNENIIYLGDTARVPYGTRSKEVITKFAQELVHFLLEKNVKALVIACNTISSVALKKIKEISPVPVIGVVMPAVKAAVLLTKTGKIGVIGTVGTIDSGSYQKEINKLDPEIKVTSVGCPLFVPLAEEGLHNHLATQAIAEEYLEEIKKACVDTLILGCTHYPLLLDTIKNVMGPDIKLVDSAKPTAEELEKVLEEKNISSENQNPVYDFYVTDAPERVYKVGGRFFGEALNGRLEKITLPTV